MLGDNPIFQFVDSPGFWVVTSHELVSAVDRDQERFSSQLGGTSMPSLTDESLAIFRQMMLNMDHPQHSRLRRILQPIFTPRSIERLRASIEQNATDILSGVAGDLDLVTAVSAEMPLRVLADLFGMPQEDRHLIFAWSNALLGADNPSAAQHAEDSMAALAGMMAYGQAMADDRRADPRDDIVSRIVTAEVDGERLTDTEFQMFWLLLVVAGNETTRNAVSGSVHRPPRARPLVVARRAPRAPADRGGGAAPARVAGAALPPHGHPRHRARRPAGAGGRQGGDLVRRRQPGPRRVRRPAPPRPAPRARTRTSPSASVRTSASGPTSPGWRRPRCCAPSSRTHPT